ncbi:porin family protein [Sunxiuqinia elliptica]|uniref:Outer membrane protein beta-barrel domain-containing protein n=1 Tax=Sunxiuqinia elliptica TaxID=655355 RepID=A0A1I2CD09_9BACT|nr:porin family protein [Sunxiuqinia elliptica]SFE65703.1 hypothetical protein SAMN05216283_101683 [Sunxiuqinia elliptica]
MKKIMLFSLLLLGIVLAGQAQDRIVTVSGDTIDCQVTKSSGRWIHFTLQQQGIETQGKLKQEQVSQLIRSEDTGPIAFIQSDWKKWRLSVSGGIAYQLGTTDDSRKDMQEQGLTQAQIDDYHDQFMLGWQSSASIHRMVNPTVGVGLQYRLMYSDADLRITLDPQDGNHLYHGQMTERMYINYVGASVLSQQSLTINKKLQLSALISAGVAFYRDEAEILEGNLLFTGEALALTTELGLEYFVTPKISIGLSANLFASKLNKVKMDNGYTSDTIKLDEDEQQSISALDLSTGLRFYF